MYQDTIRVMIADQHPLILAGLRETIRTNPGLELIGSAATGPEALGIYFELLPDVLILDMTLPEMSGVDVIRAIRLSAP